jgi:hypothetical protein
VTHASMRAQSVGPVSASEKSIREEHLCKITSYAISARSSFLTIREAINSNIKSLLRRGRGYKNLRYLLLKAQRMAANRAEFIVLKEAA